MTHPSSDGIHDVAPATFVIFSGIGDENRHFRILVQDLLYATVVNALAGIAPSFLPGVSIFLIIAEILLASQVVGRVLRRGLVGGGRRGVLAIVERLKLEPLADDPTNL